LDSIGPKAAGPGIFISRLMAAKNPGICSNAGNAPVNSFHPIQMGKPGGFV
jgi:hypothetical protein